MKNYFLTILFFLSLTQLSFSQCNNFNNSIIAPSAGTVNNCNSSTPSTTASICADFNISFSGGNASFTYGYTINGVNTTFGPINSNQPSQFPNIVCATIPCGSTITFFIIAYSNPNGGGNVCNGSNASVSTAPFSPLTPMPIELVDFIYEKRSNQGYLKWTTALENNNAYFEIQQSTDGHNWSILEKVKGAGTSTLKNQYEYKLETPNGGKINYYRLKQVDFDSNFSFSNIISSERIINKASISISPNPSSDYINILDANSEENEKSTYIIYNSFSQAQLKGFVENGAINIASLPIGLYFLDLRSENEKHIIKFYKN